MKDFPCTDDAPTNNGYSERDWDEIRTHIPPYEENDWIEDEEIETPRENTFTIVNRGDGGLNCMNDEK